MAPSLRQAARLGGSDLARRRWSWWVELDDIRAVVGTEVHVGPAIPTGSRIIQVQWEVAKPFAAAAFDVHMNLSLVSGGAETRADVEAGTPIVPWFWAKTGFEWHPKALEASETYDVGIEVVGAELRPAMAISTDSAEPVFWQIGVLWALP